MSGIGCPQWEDGMNNGVEGGMLKGMWDILASAQLSAVSAQGGPPEAVEWRYPALSGSSAI